MNKLNDNQKNLAIVGVGVFIAIVLFVMRYFDQGTIEELALQKTNTDNQIKTLKNQEVQTEQKKEALFLMRANTDAVKTLLPEDKQVTEFMELLEKFRKQNEMKPFLNLKKVETHFDIFGDAPTEQPDPRAKNTRNQPATASNPFNEDAYLVEFEGTFDQMGELIAKVESYERFFSVKDIVLDFPQKNLEFDLIDKRFQGKVKLLLTTFTFTNPDPSVDERVKVILDGYSPSVLLRQNVQKRREELLKKSTYEWLQTTIQQDPFYPFRGLRPNFPTDLGTPTQGDPTLTKDDPDKNKENTIEKEFESLVNDYNSNLTQKALSADWVELDENLKATNFEARLKDINLSVFSSEFDPDGAKRSKVEKMNADLKEWLDYIKQIQLDIEIQQTIRSVTEKLKVIEKDYVEAKEGKENAKELLKKIIAEYNESFPKLRRFKNKEEDFPVIENLRKKLEYFYERASTQLEVMELSKKLELTGMVYLRNNPDRSVVFINNKPASKNSTLTSGFKIEEIKDGWVVLSYKGETIPLRMRTVAKNK